MESLELLVGKKIGNLYITSQKGSRVYCYCSNCGNYNIEYSYFKIMYYIKQNRSITCGCTSKKQVEITKNLIGARYDELVVLKQKDNKTVVCKCTCGKLVKTNITNLENKNISMCKKCMENRIKEKEVIMSGRNRKELYYIWIKFKELYNNPTKNFKKNIIDNGIKFFPSIIDTDNGFEYFYQWAITNGYGKISGCCYLERLLYSKNFAGDNCIWTTDKKSSYYKFPKLNEERENQYLLPITNYCYDEDNEINSQDLEEYYDCEDIDINSEEFKRDLELFRKLIKNKKN